MLVILGAFEDNDTYTIKCVNGTSKIIIVGDCVAKKCVLFLII